VMDMVGAEVVICSESVFVKDCRTNDIERIDLRKEHFEEILIATTTKNGIINYIGNMKVGFPMTYTKLFANHISIKKEFAKLTIILHI
jgi:hypothetical protein